jgi:hypothetical protein
MALLTLAQLKAHLKVQTTGQDTLLSEYLAEATALAEGYLNQPITAAERTVYLPVLNTRGWDVLYLPSYIDDTAPTVTDPDGTAVDASDYRVDRYTGALYGVSSYRFAYGQHVVTATMGLSAHPDYATRIEPVVNAGIRDYAADLYLRRNPAAAFEAAGAGVSVTYNESANQGLPPRIATALAPWRRRNV